MSCQSVSVVSLGRAFVVMRDSLSLATSSIGVGLPILKHTFCLSVLSAFRKGCEVRVNVRGLLKATKAPGTTTASLKVKYKIAVAVQPREVIPATAMRRKPSPPTFVDTFSNAASQHSLITTPRLHAQMSGFSKRIRELIVQTSFHDKWSRDPKFHVPLLFNLWLNSTFCAL